MAAALPDLSGFLLPNGELDLIKVNLHARTLPFHARTELMSALFDRYFVERQLTTAVGREVVLKDVKTGELRPFLLFTSNNYLGLANHPHIAARMKDAMAQYGTGLGSSPAGARTALHRELETKIAKLVHCEDALLFTSGYTATLAIVTTFGQKEDALVCDQNIHMCFYEGAKATSARSVFTRHNDMKDLHSALAAERKRGTRDLFVCVEGIYSMTGDAGPLDQIAEVCRQHGAILVVDDAHGTGVMGEKGGGTHEHYGVPGSVDVMMSCFSKAFALTGGFVAGKKHVVDTLRGTANPYLFSTTLTPPHVAAAIGALEVLEREPERLAKLRANVKHVVSSLAAAGITVDAPGAIVALQVPNGMNVPSAKTKFREAGLAVAHFSYPAVAAGNGLFRISITTEHQTADLDKLCSVIKDIWASR